MPDTFDGTSNMRANQEIKSGAGTSQPSTSGPAIGGMDNMRADLTVKAAGNKASGPTGGPAIGGTDNPGATIK